MRLVPVALDPGAEDGRGEPEAGVLLDVGLDPGAEVLGVLAGVGGAGRAVHQLEVGSRSSPIVWLTVARSRSSSAIRSSSRATRGARPAGSACSASARKASSGRAGRRASGAWRSASARSFSSVWRRADRSSTAGRASSVSQRASRRRAAELAAARATSARAASRACACSASRAVRSSRRWRARWARVSRSDSSAAASRRRRTWRRRPGRGRRGRPGSRRRDCELARPRGRSPRSGGGAPSALSSRSKRSAVRLEHGVRLGGQGRRRRGRSGSSRRPSGLCQCVPGGRADDGGLLAGGALALEGLEVVLEPLAGLRLLGDRVDHAPGRGRSGRPAVRRARRAARPSGARASASSRRWSARSAPRGGRRPRPSRGPCRPARRGRPPCETRRASRAGCRARRSPSGRQSVDPAALERPRSAHWACAWRARRSSSVAASRASSASRRAWSPTRLASRRRRSAASSAARTRLLDRRDEAVVPRLLQALPGGVAVGAGGGQGVLGGDLAVEPEPLDLLGLRLAPRPRARSTRRAEVVVLDLGGVELGLEPVDGLGRGDRQGFERVERARPEAEGLQMRRRRLRRSRSRASRSRRAGGRRGRPAPGRA